MVKIINQYFTQKNENKNINTQPLSLEIKGYSDFLTKVKKIIPTGVFENLLSLFSLLKNYTSFDDLLSFFPIFFRGEKSQIFQFFGTSKMNNIYIRGIKTPETLSNLGIM